MDAFYPPRNFGAIPPACFDSARVVVLPIPYDGTTTYKSGVRDGAAAIIDASQYLELYDHELDREIYRAGIHTLDEIEPVVSSPERMVERVFQVARTLSSKLVVMLGGEHSLTLGMVRAACETYPRLSVLQLDAHPDLRDEYQGSRFSHACVMRRVLECCPAVQVGIRSLSLEEHDVIEARKFPVFFAERLTPDSPGEIVPYLTENVYITIDLDALDPSIMSAVGTPEPGGFGWYQTLDLLREVAHHKRIVGFDLVELCPSVGPAACAFTAAKLAYKLIGYVTQGWGPGAGGQGTGKP
ncbi:MAG: agmatinase [Chloroflexi bacterium]|nr:agmatinase [Chloroflexota bacterium]